MELNLSYEQSKKILELGYDFSSICTKFELKTDTEYRVVYGRPVERGSRKEIESSESMEGDGRIVHLRNRSMLDPLMIPIIPEEALEKCLPTRLSFATYNYGYLIYDYLHSKFHYYEGMDAFYGHEKIHKSFNSPYETFLWCHQHCPEELKAKFTKELKV